jgi:site-specific recombinase XerD
MVEGNHTAKENALQKVLKEIRESKVLCDKDKKALLRYDMINTNNMATIGTRRLYLRIVKRLGEHLDSKGKAFATATSEDIDRYIQKFTEKRNSKGKGLSVQTLNLYKIAIRQFYKIIFTDDDGRIPKAIRNIKTVKKPDNDNITKEKLLTPEEVRGMVQAVDNPRDRALLSLMYHSAMRCDELVSIRLRGVEFREDEVIVEPSRSKTKIRKVHILEDVSLIREWVNYHPQNDDPDAPLFINKGGGEVSHKYVRLIMKNAAKKAGIRKRVWPHLARHSKLSFLAKNGLCPSQLSLIAGWVKTSNMHTIYVHYSDDEVADSLREIAGIKKKREEETRPVKNYEECLSCGHKNPVGFTVCDKCNSPLNMKEVLRQKQDMDELLNKLKQAEPIIRKLTEHPGFVEFVKSL